MKVSAVIRLCGGAVRVASACGVRAETVRYWVKNDRIPDKYIPAMREAFAGIVSSDIFDDLQGVRRESTQTSA